tara:strand:+ start:596 stop:1282 length:687 start_codon:yes stop_codon:yes gene_type:complete
MDKKLKQKILKWFYIVAGTVFVILSSYGAGTFFPNTHIKDKILKAKELNLLQEWKSYGFFQPSIEYSNKTEFVLAVGKCIAFHNLQINIESRVHRDIIVAMAVLETGYGTSRFANEANNLFGIRTWRKNEPQLKAKGNPDAPWGVKKYKTKCDSVLDMIETINRHSAYESFRTERAEQLDSGKIDLDKQVDLLAKWSTNPDYVKLVKAKAKKVNEILLKHYNGKVLAN